MKHHLVDDKPEELAKFLHTNRQLDPQKKREFLATRLAVCFVRFYAVMYCVCRLHFSDSCSGVSHNYKVNLCRAGLQLGFVKSLGKKLF